METPWQENRHLPGFPGLKKFYVQCPKSIICSSCIEWLFVEILTPWPVIKMGKNRYSLRLGKAHEFCYDLIPNMSFSFDGGGGREVGGLGTGGMRWERERSLPDISSFSVKLTTVTVKGFLLFPEMFTIHGTPNMFWNTTYFTAFYSLRVCEQAGHDLSVWNKG